MYITIHSWAFIIFLKCTPWDICYYLIGMLCWNIYFEKGEIFILDHQLLHTIYMFLYCYRPNQELSQMLWVRCEKLNKFCNVSNKIVFPNNHIMCIRKMMYISDKNEKRKRKNLISLLMSLLSCINYNTSYQQNNCEKYFISLNMLVLVWEIWKLP